MTPSNYTRRVQYPLISPTTTVAMSVGASHSESGAIPADSVRLCGTVACNLAFGANPVATSSSMLLPASTPECFQFVPGQQISAIGSGSGTLFITYGP
jgi:hypothetical protein